MKKILGVYHLAVMNHYMDIVCEQFDLLHSSGLYKRSNKLLIYISCYDNNSVLDSKLKEYDPDDKFLIFKSNDNLKEKFAINDFRKHIKDEDHVFYFHSKGVSRDKTGFHAIWRRILNFYTLNKWKICVQLLEQYDAVGCYLLRWPVHHFSGNFWWAKTDYITNLPNCGEYYLAPEMWLGANFNNNFVTFSNENKKQTVYHLTRTDEDILENAACDVVNNKHFLETAVFKKYCREKHNQISMNDKTICIHMQTYEPHFVFTANLIDSLYTKTDIESLRINIYCFFDNQECISKFCDQFPEQSNKIHCVSLVDVVRNKLPSEIVFNDPISCLDLNNPEDELKTCESVDISWANRRRRYLNIKRSYGILYLQHLGYDFTWCLDSESLVLENTSIKSMIEYHIDKPCLYAYPTEPGLISKSFSPAKRIFEWEEQHPGVGVRHNDFWIVSNSLFRDMITELISKYRKAVSYFINGSELLLYECYMYHHYKTQSRDIQYIQLPKNFCDNRHICGIIENPETDILNSAKILNECYFNNTLSYRGDMLKWPEFKTPRGRKLLQHLNIKIAVSNWQGDEGWKKK